MTLRDSDILNFPDAPDFISKPPEYSLVELIAICERMLPFWNEQRNSKPEPPFVGEPFSLLEVGPETDIQPRDCGDARKTTK